MPTPLCACCILDGAGELVLLVFRRHLLSLLDEFLDPGLVLGLLVNFDLPAFDLLRAPRPAASRAWPKSEKCGTTNHALSTRNKHGADAHHQALFEGTQIEAIQVARHNASGPFEFEDAMPARHVATHVPRDMVARVGIEQRLAIDGGLADIRIEVQQPLGLVSRRAAAERQLLPVAEIIPIERDAIGQQLGDGLPAVQRGEFQVLAVL